jgi:hypothetical protein
MYRYIYLFSRYIPSCHTNGFKGDAHMRKILFIGLVLLALLVAMPAAVSAAASDTVTVSGSIGGFIEVDVAAATLSLGSMTVAGPNTAATTMNVNSSYAAWGVDVSTTNSGKMVDTTPNPDLTLTNPLQFSNDVGVNWHTVSMTDFFTGSAGPIHSETIDVKQEIVTADPAGDNYSITLTFTGASN